METEQELKNLIREAAEANGTLNKIDAVGKKFEEVGGKMTAVGKGLTTHVTLPLAAVGAAGAKSFAEVDKTMQLTNKTMGNTEEQAEMLNKAMKDAAANSTFGMTDAATATLNFARAGLDAEQAASALAPSMNLAAGEGGNLDTVSAGLVATINGFHGSFSDAGKYADVFAAACNNSALDVDSLSSAMSVAAPIFSAAGYSVNDAALYMGVMANNGIDADKAANSLKTGLARLVSPAKEGAEKMAELGISVTNADGTMKDSVTVQRELHEAFGKLSESEQIAAASAIFGKNQMAPWLALINTAPGDVDALNGSLENCAGTTEEMAQAMMSGFGGSLEKLKSSIDVLMTSIGEALAPTIQKVADVVQKLVDKFNALTPAQQETIVKIGLVVAAVGPALVVFGKLTTGIGQGMQAFSNIGKSILVFKGNAQAGIGIAGSLANGMKALWGVLMANPIILVIAAIAAAVAALIYAYNHSEKFREFVNKLWEGIKTAFEGIKTAIQAAMNFVVEVFQAVSQKASEIWEGIKTFISGTMDAIKTTMETIWNAISGVVTAVWETIKGVVQVAILFIKEILTAAFNILTLPWRFIWENFGGVITAAWEKIKETVSTAIDAIKTVIETVWNAIVAFLTPVLEGIKTAFTTAWNAIKTVVTTAVNAIKTTIQTVWNAIKAFSVYHSLECHQTDGDHCGECDKTDRHHSLERHKNGHLLCAEQYQGYGQQHMERHQVEYIVRGELREEHGDQCFQLLKGQCGQYFQWHQKYGILSVEQHQDGDHNASHQGEGHGKGSDRQDPVVLQFFLVTAALKTPARPYQRPLFTDPSLRTAFLDRLVQRGRHHDETDHVRAERFEPDGRRRGRRGGDPPAEGVLRPVIIHAR